MDKKDYIFAFNNHFIEFLEDIKRVFPDDNEIKSTILLLKNIKNINPSLILKVFNKSVKIPYETQIMENNLSYFLEKDYSSDIKFEKNESSAILAKISEIKLKIILMDEAEKKKIAKYLQNLCKLTELYNIN